MKIVLFWEVRFCGRKVRSNTDLVGCLGCLFISVPYLVTMI